ncbi:hypothetical protein K3495_g1750 [Podosphaera aphanis]|nr:hypothetical protein K3495_g1750 [Podosphaera aphanis]
MAAYIALDNEPPFRTTAKEIHGRLILNEPPGANYSSLRIAVEGLSRTSIKHRPRSLPQSRFRPPRVETHQFLYMSQRIFPDDESREHPSARISPSGDYEYRFVFRFPMNTNCETAKPPYYFGTILRENELWMLKHEHIIMKLPPSLVNVDPQSADITYSINIIGEGVGDENKHQIERMFFKFLPAESASLYLHPRAKIYRSSTFFSFPRKFSNMIKQIKRSGDRAGQTPMGHIFSDVAYPIFLSHRKRIPFPIHISIDNRSNDRLFLISCSLSVITLTYVRAGRANKHDKTVSMIGEIGNIMTEINRGLVVEPSSITTARILLPFFVYSGKLDTRIDHPSDLEIPETLPRASPTASGSGGNFTNGNDDGNSLGDESAPAELG